METVSLTGLLKQHFTKAFSDNSIPLKQLNNPALNSLLAQLTLIFSNRLAWKHHQNLIFKLVAAHPFITNALVYQTTIRAIKNFVNSKQYPAQERYIKYQLQWLDVSFVKSSPELITFNERCETEILEHSVKKQPRTSFPIKTALDALKQIFKLPGRFASTTRGSLVTSLFFLSQFNLVKAATPQTAGIDTACSSVSSGTQVLLRPPFHAPMGWGTLINTAPFGHSKQLTAMVWTLPADAGKDSDIYAYVLPPSLKTAVKVNNFPVSNIVRPVVIANPLDDQQFFTIWKNAESSQLAFRCLEYLPKTCDGRGVCNPSELQYCSKETFLDTPTDVREIHAASIPSVAQGEPQSFALLTKSQQLGVLLRVYLTPLTNPSKMIRHSDSQTTGTIALQSSTKAVFVASVQRSPNANATLQLVRYPFAIDRGSQQLTLTTFSSQNNRHFSLFVTDETVIAAFRIKQGVEIIILTPSIRSRRITLDGRHKNPQILVDPVRKNLLLITEVPQVNGVALRAHKISLDDGLLSDSFLILRNYLRPSTWRITAYNGNSFWLIAEERHQHNVVFTGHYSFCGQPYTLSEGSTSECTATMAADKPTNTLQTPTILSLSVTLPKLAQISMANQKAPDRTLSSATMTLTSKISKESMEKLWSDSRLSSENYLRKELRLRKTLGTPQSESGQIFSKAVQTLLFHIKQKTNRNILVGSREQQRHYLSIIADAIKILKARNPDYELVKLMIQGQNFISDYFETYLEKENYYPNIPFSK